MPMRRNCKRKTLFAFALPEAIKNCDISEPVLLLLFLFFFSLSDNPKKSYFDECRCGTD
jgi:hypothetical protein